jgi:hypothetical protein
VFNVNPLSIAHAHIECTQRIAGSHVWAKRLVGRVKHVHLGPVQMHTHTGYEHRLLLTVAVEATAAAAVV